MMDTRDTRLVAGYTAGHSAGRAARPRGQSLARGLAGAVLLAITVGTQALALPPLSQNQYVDDRLISARIADVVRRKCPTIKPRIFTFLNEREKLKRYVLKLGYSTDQINDYISDKTQQKRIFDLADQYMAAKGVVEGDVESYCRLGRAEIAAGSIAGSLLYET